MEDNTIGAGGELMQKFVSNHVFHTRSRGLSMTKRSPGFSPRLVSQKRDQPIRSRLGRRCCHPCDDDPVRLSGQRVALLPHKARPPWSPSILLRRRE
jgi:hypothetical protein